MHTEGLRGKEKMIIDGLKNSGYYTRLGEAFEKGFAFIKKAIEGNLAAGKYEIEGDTIFASVQEYESFAAEGRVFEGHKKYIDLQCILKGTERIDAIDVNKAFVTTPYSEEIEAAFFEAKESYTSMILSEGDFAIFFPYDLHRPGLRIGNDATYIKKIIVKIHV